MRYEPHLIIGKIENEALDFIFRKQSRQLVELYSPGPGVVAQACNPSTLGGRGQEIKTILVNMVKPPSLLKIQKISWAWWRVPVIPATQEAEAGELPEPRRWRLQ